MAASCGLATLTPSLLAQGLAQLTSFNAGADSSEIVVHDKTNQLLFNTYGLPGNAGVQIIDFANPSSLSLLGTVDLSTVGGLSAFSISSVAADPQGRFGVASFIPQTRGTDAGKLVFFDPVARTVLHSVDVGFHPDTVKFSTDGSRVFVGNEGEPVSAGAGLTAPHYDKAGSLTVVDLAGINSVNVGTVTGSRVATYDFSNANLDAGVNLNSLRVATVNSAAANRYFDAEPEGITQAGNKVYVSLQEGNAIAEFDLTAQKWTKINPLGTIQQTIDGSSVDGVQINDQVHGMPMPDGIASYTVAGKTYLVSANEGDTRRPDFAGNNHPVTTDEARVNQLGTGGRPALDPAYKAALDLQYGGNVLATTALGELRVSITDGDLDSDGDIDRLTMFGTRSFSIWDADTGARVADTGSLFETITSLEVPSLYNSSGVPGAIDSRSTRKGPEPEGVVIGQLGDQIMAFVGLERVGGIMMFNITDPLNALFVDYLNTGEVAPEGLDFISAADSPNGRALLLVGYEVAGKIGVYEVPEARTMLPAALALGAGVVTLWRRRRL